MRPLFALLLLALLAPAAPVPKGMKAVQTPPLVGLWKPAGTCRTQYDFDADGGMRCWTEGNERSAASYTCTADPDSTPKRMTWVNAGKRWEAVYELDGDSLNITYVKSGLKLPATVGPCPDGSYEQLSRDTSGK